jgi:hypothetical protein
MDNEFIDILKKLVAEQGNVPLTDAKKCRAFLADYTRNEFKKESRLIVQAVEAGVANAINGADDLAACKKAQIRELEEEHGLNSAFAENVVNALALVLRGDTTVTVSPSSEKAAAERAAAEKAAAEKAAAAVKAAAEKAAADKAAAEKAAAAAKAAAEKAAADKAAAAKAAAAQSAPAVHTSGTKSFSFSGFLYDGVSAVAEFIDDISYEMEDNASCIIFSIVCAGGIALGSWVLWGRAIELSFWLSFGLSAAMGLAGFFVSLFMVMPWHGSGDEISRAVKILSAIILTVAGTVCFFTIFPGPDKAVKMAIAENPAPVEETTPLEEIALLEEMTPLEEITLQTDTATPQTNTAMPPIDAATPQTDTAIPQTEAAIPQTDMATSDAPPHSSALIEPVEKENIFAVALERVKSGLGSLWNGEKEIPALVEEITILSAPVKSDVNLRKTPSGSGDLITVLKKGDIIIITGEVANGWMPVEYDGKSGYVSAEYVGEQSASSKKVAFIPDAGTIGDTVTGVIAKTPRPFFIYIPFALLGFFICSKIWRSLSRYSGSSRYNDSEKNWGVLLALSFFLGGLGADRFYAGRIGLGILKLLSMFVGVGAVWWVIDLFLALSGRQKDCYDNYITSDTSAGVIVGKFIVVAMIVGIIIGGIFLAQKYL